MLRKKLNKFISNKVYKIVTSCNTYIFNNSTDFLNKINVFHKLGIDYKVSIVGDYEKLKVDYLECQKLNTMISLHNLLHLSYSI